MENVQVDNQVLLNRARLRLEEGQPLPAREVLEQVHPENPVQQQELDYLQAWSYVLEACWEEAEAILAPLVKTIEAETEDADEAQKNEHRKRHAICRFYLGNVAANIGRHDDAARHYAKCIRLLQDRRVQIPRLQPLRIRARYSLGTTLLMRGSYTSAKQYYDDALRLYNLIQESCQYDLREDLAAICYGFCTLYWQTGNLLDGLEMGKKALGLYKDLGERPMVGRMHNQLGHIYMLLCEYREASEHFTDALAIATTGDQPKMIMLNCSALAQLRMAEGQLQDAMDYCELALESMSRSKNDQLTGIAYLTTGKVMQALAESLQGEQKHQRMKDALQYLEQACSILDDTQAYGLIAEAYGKRAEVLEMLGRTQEAVVCWRSAFSAQGDSYGATWN